MDKQNNIIGIDGLNIADLGQIPKAEDDGEIFLDVRHPQKDHPLKRGQSWRAAGSEKPVFNPLKLRLVGRNIYSELGT